MPNVPENTIRAEKKQYDAIFFITKAYANSILMLPAALAERIALAVWSARTIAAGDRI